ncbi:MAG: hypothetical protein K2L41_07000, partial [Muribaculaceae bacterium]|nr:hypothetical protein [Muribaculaceae bacterium]
MSNSRYAVGRNGKIYTISDIENAIVSWDGSTLETYAQTPSRKEGRWNGTAINFDDAGNIVYNYNFTAAQSVTDWGVIKAGTKEQYDINVTGDVSNIGSRCDIIGHIVGDVTKEAYAFVTFASSGNVGMLTFTGDGSKTTKLELQSVQTVDQLAKVISATPSIVVCPSETTLDKFKATGAIPMDHRFYFPVGINGSISDGQVGMTEGYIARWDIDSNNQPVFTVDKMPMGNRGYVGIADFTISGKTYIVRNYVSEEFLKAHPGLYTTNWTNVMNFGIYDAETGELVADWMGSEYGNSMGMGMLSAEVVDDNTVNIYTYATSSQDATEYNTAMGSYAAMVKFTVTESQSSDILEGKGTASDPYLIQSAEDLCNAWKVMADNQKVYFKQTADIDMKDVENYTAINGFNGGWVREGEPDKHYYSSTFEYDGDNHLIRNFGPKNRNAETDNGYYCQTIFGVLSGSVKNLGIVDCNIVNAGQGSGALAAYAGHSDATTCTVDNVFVTGKIHGSSYTGGMFGTSGNTVNVTNSYVVADVKGSYTGGIMGRLRNN